MRLRISGRGLVKISAGTGLVTLWLGLQIISTTHDNGGGALEQSQTIPELSSNLPSRYDIVRIMLICPSDKKNAMLLFPLSAEVTQYSLLLGSHGGQT